MTRSRGPARSKSPDRARNVWWFGPHSDVSGTTPNGAFTFEVAGLTPVGHQSLAGGPVKSGGRFRGFSVRLSGVFEGVHDMSDNTENKQQQLPKQQHVEVEYGPDVPLAVRLELERQHLS